MMDTTAVYEKIDYTSDKQIEAGARALCAELGCDWERNRSRHDAYRRAAKAVISAAAVAEINLTASGSSIEITEDMARAGYDAFYRMLDYDGIGGTDIEEMVRTVYEDMHSKAPKR